MKRHVVDTNVPIVANGRPDPRDRRHPSTDCRIAAVTFLKRFWYREEFWSIWPAIFNPNTAII